MKYLTTGLLLAAAQASAQSMINGGVLPGGNSSRAFGISGDGNVVVGYSQSPDGDRAFR